jgi:predicted aspartyl protease
METEEEEEIFVAHSESQTENRKRTSQSTSNLLPHLQKVFLQPHWEQEYNIVQDLKRHDAHVSFGQLLKNPQYRKQLKAEIERVEKDVNVNLAQTHVNDNNKYTAARCIIRYKMNPVEAILDSGAAACIISTSLASKLKLKPHKASDIIVITADGQRKRSLGIITNTPLIIQGAQFTVDLQLIESTQDTLLLGINWFKTFDARMFFDQDKIRLRINNQLVESPIKCIEEHRPFFRILSTSIDDENSEEYEDELLREADLYSIEPEDEILSDYDWETDSNYSIEQDELEQIECPYDSYDDIFNVQELYLAEEETSLNPEQKYIISLLPKEVIFTSGTDIGRTLFINHQIPLQPNTKPNAQHPYRLNAIRKEFLEKEIKKMLDKGIIQPSESPWASPVIIVPKKTGDLRICIDYRSLNNVTITDSYPIPHVQDQLESFRTAKYFTALDLVSGYW